MNSNNSVSSGLALKLEQAIEHHHAGLLQQAQAGYLEILQADPGNQVANHNMGALLVQMNQFMSALPYLFAALEADPACSQSWINYIDALHQAGLLNEARQVLNIAREQGLQGGEVDALELRLNSINMQPSAASISNPVSLNPTAVEPFADEIDTLTGLFSRGDLIEAERLALSMTVRFPEHGFGWKVLGAIYKQKERTADALIAMQKSVALSPNDEAALSNLGLMLFESGKSSEAEMSLRRALAIKPDFAEAYCNLAIVLQDIGRMKEAEASLRSALQIKPDYAEAYNNLGHTLQEMKRTDEAEACYSKAIDLKPDCAEALSNLGRLRMEAGRLIDAETLCRRAISIKPGCVEAYSSLSAILLEAGRIQEAEVNLRRALQLKPDSAKAHSNLIFALDMMADIGTASVQEERKLWNAIHAAHLYRHRQFANSPDSERRLNIGYVSADFRMHSAAFVFGAMLVDYDREHFDVYAYSNSMNVDRVTRDFQQNVTGWRNIYGLSDDAVAELIREDGIDILVDLSGHSAGNRLLVFARKPAPIQVTAWGYASGTGMSAMDVLFSDPVFVPPDERHFYAEQVRYIPSAIGSYAFGALPAVNALPALSGDGITFGSFNRLAKSSEEVYRVWAKVLQALPDSRMIIKTQAMGDVVTREHVQRYFTREGIDPARILLQGGTSREAHLAAFNQVDIALDPFPHGGGVTALEGLMMGVPLITLRWPTLTGRVSASIMTTLGLTDWIADTPEQYVDLAVRKAGDLQALAALRQALRGIFAASVIGDQLAYVRETEREYRKLWQEWCTRNPV